MGSGRYSNAFERKEEFARLCRSIERALREHSGDPGAHIRHLALSAWSAGYGAINEILRHGDDGIDAVVLLDGLHAGWKNGARRDGTVQSVSSLLIAPTLEFARKALRGEGIFVMTHSWVDPVTYPSTAVTAELIEQELGVVPRSVRRPTQLLEQVKAVDIRGLHIWAYRGHDEMIHCAHISLIARAVRDVLEEQWETPAMDRSVPSTPAPKLGTVASAPGMSTAAEPVSSDAGVGAALPTAPGAESLEAGAQAAGRPGPSVPDAELTPPLDSDAETTLLPGPQGRKPAPSPINGALSPDPARPELPPAGDSE